MIKIFLRSPPSAKAHTAAVVDTNAIVKQIKWTKVQSWTHIHREKLREVP
jgi:hypothetical protein